MTSWIWKYFDKYADSAVCKDCSATLSVKSSTWGLRRHLQAKHQIDQDRATGTYNRTGNSSMVIKCDPSASTHDEDETNSAIQRVSEIPRSPSDAAKQPGSSNGHAAGSFCRTARTSEASTPVPSSFQQAASVITSSIARMIAIDMLPMSFCENKGFRDFMDVLAPDYPLPNENTIKRSIERLHSDTKATLAMKLNEYDFVVVTTDIWTSREVTSYLTTTVHAITPSWDPVSHTLSTVEILHWYTADNLRQHLTRVIAEWQLRDKIFATVHDNSAHISTCVRRSKSLGASVPCLAHMLQSAVSKALRLVDVNELLKKASNVVKHFSHSTVAAEELESAQMENELPVHHLIQSCKTLWNSAFYMVQRLIEQRVAVSCVLSNIRATKSAQKLIISEDDWLGLQRLEELLEPLEAVTTVVGAFSDATLSLTRPLVHGLLKNFYTTRESESDLEASFKSVIRDEFLERFLETTGEGAGVTLISTFLDPRYKDLPGESEDAIANTKIAIQEKLDELSEITSSSIRSLNRRAALDFLFTGRRSTEKSTRTSGEIFTYTKEPCVDTQCDPRQWWKENQFKYPRLSTLARRYLAIPATSTPVERVFSHAGNNSRAKRGRLASDNVDPLIFMHQNADLA